MDCKLGLFSGKTDNSGWRVLVWVVYHFECIKPFHIVKLEGAEVQHHVLKQIGSDHAIEL